MPPPRRSPTHGIGGERVAAEVAIAKLRVGEAAGTGAAIAHQVHGAMGFTYEHSLHHSTRRLWAWREEFGNETLLGRSRSAAWSPTAAPTRCGPSSPQRIVRQR